MPPPYNTLQGVFCCRKWHLAEDSTKRLFALEIRLFMPKKQKNAHFYALSTKTGKIRRDFYATKSLKFLYNSCSLC